MSEPIIKMQPQSNTATEATAASDSNKATEPPMNSQSQTGKTAVDTQMLEGEALAYESLIYISRKIAIEVKETVTVKKVKNPTIVFLDNSAKDALVYHQALVLQLQHLSNSFTEAQTNLDAVFREDQKLQGQPEAMAEPSTAISAGVAAFTSLLGLFREDISYSSAAYPIHIEAFENALTRSLLRTIPAVSVRNPRQLLYRPALPRQKSHEKLLDRLSAVENARLAAHSIASKLLAIVMQLQFRIAPPAPQAPPDAAIIIALTERLLRLKGPVDAATEILGDLDEQWKELQKSFSEWKGKTSTFLAYAQKGEEILACAASPESTWFLSCEVISLRANVRTRDGFFTNLGGRDGVALSGGAVATYALMDSDAQVVNAATHRFRSPYVKVTDDDQERSGNSFDPAFRDLE
jgi:hypothetical protein